MRRISAQPDTLQDLVKNAEPGDVIELRPGKYGPLHIRRLKGRADAPITIIGPRDAIFDGGQRFEDFREEANRICIRVQQEGGFPSLGREAYRGFIRLKNSRHIHLRGFSIKGCWPTGIYLNNSANIEIAGLDIREGTFAIFADGRRTRDLVIEDCHYIQDIEEGRLWRDINWAIVHANIKIDPKTDARAFDGEFFRSFGIAGNVTIANNDIRHAFNGVHMYHSDRDGMDRNENRNVRIFGNTFRYIRDNAIEPEWGGWNWWIYHNDIFNCHKWLSLDMERSGHFYIFGNTGRFDERPGPDGDENVGGAVFKLPETQRTSEGMHYVFNNSFYLRSAYVKKQEIHNLWHFNNAVQYCDTEIHEGAICTKRAMFGKSDKPDAAPSKAFTKDWRRLNIRFLNDMIDNHSFPEGLISHGYPIEDGLPGSPQFRNPAAGDFQLSRHSLARNAATGAAMDLSNGSVWRLPPGENIGAHQGRTRTAPPAIIPGFDETDQLLS